MSVIFPWSWLETAAFWSPPLFVLGLHIKLFLTQSGETGVIWIIIEYKSFRLISLLHIVSKIMKKHVTQVLDHSFLCPQQAGFRPRHKHRNSNAVGPGRPESVRRPGSTCGLDPPRSFRCLPHRSTTLQNLPVICVDKKS